MYLFYLSLLISMITPTSIIAAMDQDCDLTGKTLKRFSEVNQERCWQACEKSSLCKGAVFISGWNNCHLLTAVKGRHKIRMFSRYLAQSGYQLDFTGKDLKMVAVATKEICQKSCQDEDLCKGYTFIEGYRSCWLKKTSGKLISKIFYCRKK